MTGHLIRAVTSFAAWRPGGCAAGVGSGWRSSHLRAVRTPFLRWEGAGDAPGFLYIPGNDYDN